MSLRGGWGWVTKKQESFFATKCQFHQHFTSSFFCTKVFGAAFLCLQVGFVIFWQKKIGAKAACKMLVKLTQGLFKFFRIAFWSVIRTSANGLKTLLHTFTTKIICHFFDFLSSLFINVEEKEGEI